MKSVKTPQIEGGGLIPTIPGPGPKCKEENNGNLPKINGGLQKELLL